MTEPLSPPPAAPAPARWGRLLLVIAMLCWLISGLLFPVDSIHEEETLSEWFPLGQWMARALVAGPFALLLWSLWDLRRDGGEPAQRRFRRLWLGVWLFAVAATLLGFVWLKDWQTPPSDSFRFSALWLLAWTTGLLLLAFRAFHPLAKRAFWRALAVKSAFILALVVTLGAAYYSIEHWRGRRAWEAYRAEAEQRGVEFDLEKLMPPPVPDAENFAATPLLRPFQSGNPEFANRRAKVAVPESDPTLLSYDPHRLPWPNHQNWFRGERWDFTALQSYYRSSTNFPAWPTPRTPSEDVLKALSRSDSVLAELHNAAARPRTRFNIHLSEDGVSTHMPHLEVMKSLQWVVTLRSAALLEARRTDDAFADAKLAFRLSESVSGDALLIGHLVRLAMHNLALRAVWEGLADHRWTAAQLAHWQINLAKPNFAAELRHAMAGERACFNRTIEFLRRKPEMWPVLCEDGSLPELQKPDPFMHAIPAGWFWLEQINYNRKFDEFFVEALPTVNGRFDPALIMSKDAAWLNYVIRNHSAIKAILRHSLLTSLFLPSTTLVISQACQAQAFTHLAIAACALERHRLARGSYPEALAALAPEFGPLPPDPMTGQPFRYERTVDGRFRLWSIGWNGKDDGGTMVLRERSKKDLDFDQGDWVWPVPVM